ncbi:MAG: polya polymerase, partial [Deltaproteobacteria bacterium]
MEVITTHVNADFDTIASMVAARKLYTDAVIVLPGSQEETVKGFLIQSAFYTLEVRKAREIDLSKVTRVILVDIRNSARIGVFGEVVRRPGVDLHIYDHHPEEEADLHGSVEVIRRVGSTTTILVQILKERGIPITPDEATVMMLGIYEDTGSLIFPSTTVDDYLAAAHLLSCGAKLAQVSDILARDLTSGQISLLYDLIQGIRSYTIRGVEVVIAEARREEYVGDLALLVHKLRDMEAVSVLFVICQMGDRVVLVGRSRKPEVDAAAVMREFGGGGHAYAASATVKDMTTFQVRERILRVLEEKVIPRRSAADVMVSPARTVDAGETILEVHQALTRSNINAVPVMRGGAVVGILTRQVVEKAVYHGLGEERAGEYMNADYETVAPETAIERVQEIIIGKNQRLVPVVRGRELLGVITRTGLLRFLYDMRDVEHPGDEEDVDAEGAMAPRKNVANLMRDRLPTRVLALLRAAGECAERLGMKAFAVGGFVRDLVMRVTNLDVDIVVEGDGIRFAE